MSLGAVRAEVLAQPRFRAGLAEVANELGRSEASVTAEARSYLKEMVAVPRIDLVKLMTPLFDRRSFQGRIRYDTAQLQRVKDLMERFPTAILPSHRSYIDPVVLGAVLRSNGMRVPFAFGGVNMAFWPVSSVARRAGGIFVRRTFRDNPVYRFTLREYVGYLAEHGTSFEWYMEGGRSRTGKLRFPQLGLLSYVADAYLQRRCEDFVLVPVSIVYDELLDVEEYARYAAGQRKKGETLTWLGKYIETERRSYGSGAIYVAFGEPLSLREALGDPPVEVRQPGEGSIDLQNVAFEVALRINDVTPITPAAIVTLALLGSDRALTLDQLDAAPRYLLEHVRRRELPATGDLPLDSNEAIRSGLGSLMRHGIVRCDASGGQEIYFIEPDREVDASYFRNSIIHFFVTPAIAQLALLASAESGSDDPVAVVHEAALALRDLLQFEFFFPASDRFSADISEELASHDPAWEDRVAEGPVGVEAFVRGMRPLVAPTVLRPFLDPYHVVADALAAHGDDAIIDESALVEHCLARAHQYLLQRRIRSPDAISALLFETGLTLARRRNLICAGEGVSERRTAFAIELGKLIRCVERMEPWVTEQYLGLIRAEPEGDPSSSRSASMQ